MVMVCKQILGACESSFADVFAGVTEFCAENAGVAPRKSERSDSTSSQRLAMPHFGVHACQPESNEHYTLSLPGVECSSCEAFAITMTLNVTQQVCIGRPQ